MTAALLTARFLRNPDVVARDIQGELVIVPIRRGVGDLNSLYTLNSVGRALWDFLSERHSLPELIARICDEYDVTAAQAQSDIENFLDSLLEENLIQAVA